MILFLICKYFVCEFEFKEFIGKIGKRGGAGNARS